MNQRADLSARLSLFFFRAYLQSDQDSQANALREAVCSRLVRPIAVQALKRVVGLRQCGRVGAEPLKKSALFRPVMPV